MQQRVPHPCTRTGVTQQPRSQDSLLKKRKKEKIIHPRNGGFITPLSGSKYHPLSCGIFQKGANALSGRRKRQQGNILHPLPGQARLADKAISPRSRTFTFLGPESGWPLHPAAAAAADPRGRRCLQAPSRPGLGPAH